MGSPTETLALSLTGHDWASLNAGHDCAEDSALLTAGPDGGEITVEQRGDLFAYRDRVAASLSDEQVRAVLLGGEDLKRADGFEDMRDELEIIDGDCELTTFGDEIARVLRETTDGK